MFIEMSDGRDSNCKSLVLGGDRSTNCATSNVLFQSKFLFARSGRQILTEIICFVFATQVHISSTKPFKIKHLCKLVYEGESGSVKEGWALENAIEMKFFVLIFAIVCLLQVCLIGCRLALCFK